MVHGTAPTPGLLTQIWVLASPSSCDPYLDLDHWGVDTVTVPSFLAAEQQRPKSVCKQIIRYLVGRTHPQEK